MPYLCSLDIANRALQMLGEPQITSVSEDSKANTETAFAYDKLRAVELRTNTWRFAKRRALLRPIAAGTLLLAPKAWSAKINYERSALAVDDNGVIWQSLVAENMNNEPGQSAAWEQYFGPMTAALYVSTTTYYRGDLVYKLVGNAGSYAVFMSLDNDNTSDPTTAVAYAAGTTYYKGDVVSSGGFQWRLVIDIAVGITPAEGPADFDPDAIYSAAQTVTASDGYIYSSVGGSNTGNDPVTDGGVNWTNTTVAHAWKKEPGVYPTATSWLALYCGLEPANLRTPLGLGSISNRSARYVYRLPAGYLRRSVDDPKEGAVSQWGASTARTYDDWNFEGQYLTTVEPGPIVFPFIADISDVRQMDALFCEGLAAKVAEACCESLTQSTAKLSAIMQLYRKAVATARMQNGIEIGAEEPAEDDFISCRS